MEAKIKFAGPSYYRARYYDPQAGRFISTDPSRFLGGINVYNYVESNPMGRVDSLGLDWIEYTGQTLTVWPGKYKDRGHPAILQCKASSGYPGFQSSAMQNEDLGPVHEGHYYIDLSLNPYRWASIMPTGENLYSAFGVQRIRPTYPGPRPRA